mgnify:CR=1 FL=1
MQDTQKNLYKKLLGRQGERLVYNHLKKLGYKILEKNYRLYGDDVCLVEINPEMPDTRRVTWKEYELIESSSSEYYRNEITWAVFDEKANRFANLLLSRGIKKDDKVAILLMNCLEWLPIYFGILKAGCIAVPMNFRYSSDEIRYCLDLADVEVLVFGPEFVTRMDAIANEIQRLQQEIDHQLERQRENDAEIAAARTAMEQAVATYGQIEARKSKNEVEIQEKNKSVMNMERACALLEKLIPLYDYFNRFSA